MAFFYGTVGAVFHAGKSVPARVIRGDNPEAHALVGESVDVLKMLLLVGRSVIIRIGNERRAVLPPAIVYVPRNTEIEIVSGSLGTEDRLVFFHPKYIHDSLDWNTVFCEDLFRLIFMKFHAISLVQDCGDAHYTTGAYNKNRPAISRTKM